MTTIELIDERMRRYMARHVLIVEVVRDLVVDENGVASGQGIGELPIESGGLFGFEARPKDGAIGLVLKLGGEGNSSMLVSHRDDRYRPKLEQGESMQYSAFGSKALHDKDGNIVHTSADGKKVQLNGTTYSLIKDTLLDDIKDLCTKLASWAPLVVAAVAAAPSGLAADPGVATRAAAIAAAVTAGSYKSTKVTFG